MPSRSPSVASQSSLEPAASPNLATSDAPESFPHDSIVKALVPGIALRSDPGLGADRFGILPEGSRSFVVNGPVEADGYQWIQLSGLGLPPASGCATFPGELGCPVWFGWAATGDPQTGEPWFVDDPTDCPDPSLEPRDFMMLGDVEALHCYSGRDLEVTAWLPEAGLNVAPVCPAEDVAARWLYCPDGYSARVWAVEDEAVWLEVFVDPASSVEFTSTGYWAIIVGHHDDPAAEGCDAAISAGHPIYPAWAILNCRAHFVVTQLAGAAP